MEGCARKEERVGKTRTKSFKEDNQKYKTAKLKQKKENKIILTNNTMPAWHGKARTNVPYSVSACEVRGGGYHWFEAQGRVNAQMPCTAI
jgi:hypothetical protein